MDLAGFARLEAATDELVKRLTLDVQDDAERFVPIDTGELHQSLHSEFPRPLVGRVWVGTDHWIYPEYGTRYMKAEPYMRPALYRYRRDLA
jgi:HK97 gp10 family phage protein